jgi:hypothetical protein
VTSITVIVIIAKKLKLLEPGITKNIMLFLELLDVESRFNGSLVQDNGITVAGM